MRIAIVDDDPLVRAALTAVLSAEPDLTVAGEAEDGVGAVSLAAADPSLDLVLMDLRMPRLDGIEATGRITRRAGAPRVLVLTTFDVAEEVFRALRAGASGFLLKRTPPAEIVRAVRLVASGEALLFPASTRGVVERFARQTGSALPELTPREQQVLRLLAGGLSNAEIAGRLFVSAETVKSHVATLLAKLGARDRTQAVITAYETGFVRPGEQPPRPQPPEAPAT